MMETAGFIQDGSADGRCSLALTGCAVARMSPRLPCCRLRCREAGLKPRADQPGDILRSPADPVVGVVEGHMVDLSDAGRAVPQLPDNLRGLPCDTLFHVVLDRIIDHQALAAAARRRHLDDDQSGSARQ